MSEAVGTVDVRAALKEAMARLREGLVPSHTLAAELLLMHVLGRDRAWLYAHPEDTIDAELAARYLELVARRVAGTPTQYLTGHQEFWGLDFEVEPGVLIPRPETEHVVEVALERLGRLREWGMNLPRGPLRAASAGVGLRDVSGRGRLRVADVGTGSGCLAVALAKELPGAEVFATDVSAAALSVARRNAARHGLSARIQFLECNLLDALPRHAPLDLIVSNPPYVGRNDAGTLPHEVREHEPDEALYGGEQGHEIYAALIAQSGNLLTPGGVLVIELSYNALSRVRSLLDSRVWTGVGVTNDLAGIPRVLAASKL